MNIQFFKLFLQYTQIQILKRYLYQNDDEKHFIEEKGVNIQLINIELMEETYQQIILLNFIAKNTPQVLDQHLISNGNNLLKILIKSIIEQIPQIQNLKVKNFNYLARFIMSQFAYRFGGINQCIAAFGNFVKIKLKQNCIIQQLILDIFLEKLLVDQQIQQIKKPIVDLLQRIGYYQRNFGQLPQIDEERIIKRRTEFLEYVLGIYQEKQPISKKKRIRRKGSEKTPQIITNLSQKMPMIVTQMEEEMYSKKVQVIQINDEKQITSNKIMQTNGEEKYKMDEQDQVSNSTTITLDMTCQWQQRNNELVLKYEDFFPGSQMIDEGVENKIKVVEKKGEKKEGGKKGDIESEKAKVKKIRVVSGRQGQINKIQLKKNPKLQQKNEMVAEQDQAEANQKKLEGLRTGKVKKNNNNNNSQKKK